MVTQFTCLWKVTYLIKVTTVASCHNAGIHLYPWSYDYFVCTNNHLSTVVTVDDIVPFKIVLFYFDLSSDISAWIKAFGLVNQLELTGISSYPISSYPKLIWLLYEGKKSGPADKLELSGNSS